MTQPWPAPPAAVRSRNWLTVTLAAVAVVLAAAALIVALTRSGSGSGSSPTYTPAQKAEAKAKLCDNYRLAAQVAHIETTGPESDVGLARNALTNGALMLETAADAPALGSEYRNAARELASVYQTQAAMGTRGMATTEEYQSIIDDSNAKDRTMKELCGG
ncbi:hypothetical protein PP713_09455 [Mycobacterium sp. CSUR Q5927]|nr:hypothetical protein [Mycobacterium sp. CSUR Q5927]